MAEAEPRFRRPIAFLWLLRLNRTAMVAMITGAAAFAAGSGGARSLRMALAGWCLAVGGFSLDFYADRDLDIEGPRAETRHNPLSDGSLSPSTGLAFSAIFIGASFVMVAQLAPLSLLPWGAILAVVLGLALHLFETPLGRALTLGLLQALYFLMGGTAGRLSPSLALLAGVFFFAMSGGRGMIVIRDFPQDRLTRVETLPKRYGIKRAARFTAACLLIACALSLAAYFGGEFSAVYLYLDLVFVALVSACAWLSALAPAPSWPTP